MSITWRVAVTLLLLAMPVLAQQGQQVTRNVASPALEGNLVGDSPTPLVRVYLPPGYEEDAAKRYPVLYMLHGYEEYSSDMMHVMDAADALIVSGDIDPVIIVTPTAHNKYNGSLYTDSAVTGGWETFIVRDLVAYVDRTFRTIARRESRGIAGYSMGGYGTVKLAMKHPDLYSAAYAVSPGMLSFAEQNLSDSQRHFTIQAAAAAVTATSFKQFGSVPSRVRAVIASAAAYSPNPSKAPFFADFPVTADGTLVEEVWARWLRHDPLTRLQDLGNNLRRVRLKFEVGDADDLVVGMHTFSQVLTDAGIPHEFETYPGDHYSGIKMRFQTKVLPFFDAILSQESGPTVAPGMSGGESKERVK